jgi:hypothetical protein
MPSDPFMSFVPFMLFLFRLLRNLMNTESCRARLVRHRFGQTVP